MYLRIVLAILAVAMLQVNPVIELPGPPEFKAAFNGAAGKVRLVMIISPT